MIISALRAKYLVDEYLSKRVEELKEVALLDLEKLNTLITEASENGKTWIQLETLLTGDGNEVIRYLFSLGYTVNTHWDATPPYTVVSW